MASEQVEDSAEDRRDTCDHCGTPVVVPPESDPDEAVFCCVGCRSVYGAIREWGFAGYYDMREGASRAEMAPGAAPDDRELERLDDPVFVREQSEALDDERRRAEFFLEGVHCSGCVFIVEQMPEHLKGVERARLNLGRSRLELTWRPDAIDLSEVGRWLSQFGYALHPLQGDESGKQAVERRLLRRTGVSWALAANVMLLAVAMYAGLDGSGSPGLYHGFRALSFVLATGVVVYGGALFFRRAAASVRSFVAQPVGEWRLDQLSIDLPIALGISGGYLQSVVSTVTGSGEIWFDSVSVLIAALLTARWLQVRSRRIAGDAAERLRAVLPWSARRIVGDGDSDGEATGDEPKDVQTETVELDAIERHDVVEVQTGEVVPADGRLIEGGGRSAEARLQRSVLTGESRPERLETGEQIHAGVRNVGEGLWLRVERRPSDSRIGRLMAWIDERDGDAPVVAWADRIAGAFVLAVLAGALATWIGWSWVGSSLAVQHAVALLVVACPCALGIATPLALTTAVGRGAARGLFIKRDTVFQQLDGLDVAVFDKTGTVTRGEMAVESVDWAPEIGEGNEGEASTLIAQLAALEAESRHPVAEAIRRESVRRGGGGFQDAVADRREVTGDGIEGKINNVWIRAGRPAWVASQLSDADSEAVDRAALPKWYRDALEAVLETGQTPVAVSRGGELVALFGIGDPVRPEAGEVIEQLEADGITCHLISGDHPEVVDRVGDALSIPAERRDGDVSPEDKRRRVSGMIDGGATVAMVGDGVNDAAALQAASVGMAVGESAQASLDAADVFATRGGVRPVVSCTKGGREVMRVIRRNLGLSIAYNTAGISFAAAGWVTPLVAAVAMPLSSIAVVVSSVLQSSFDDSAETDEPRIAVVGAESGVGSKADTWTS